MTVQSRLRQFAKSTCLPFLTSLSVFRPYVDRVCFLLVGSAATGLCEENSDVDIAVVCSGDVYPKVAEGQPWGEGRPSEKILDGAQLHYFAVSCDEIERRLAQLDDLWLYLYSHAIVLHDVADLWTSRFAALLTAVPEVRRARVEGKLDILRRRSSVLAGLRDVHSLAAVCLENISLCLKVIALLDDVAFDPRKRMFATALQGQLGRRLEPEIRGLYENLGDLGGLGHESSFADFRFAGKLKNVVAVLCQEAEAQGFRTRLPSPDRRHTEK